MDRDDVVGCVMTTIGLTLMICLGVLGVVGKIALARYVLGL